MKVISIISTKGGAGKTCLATNLATHAASLRGQKVLLIAGMLHNPSILFLDEPLSGLDANAVILVKEILSQLKQAGKTIFYSSHIMDVVEKISDRIMIINKGEMIANGSFTKSAMGTSNNGRSHA